MDPLPIQAVWWGGRQGHRARRGGGERVPIVQRADHGWRNRVGLWNRLRCQLNAVEWEGEEGVGPTGWARVGPTHVARLLDTTALTTQAWARAPGCPLPSLLIIRSQGSQELTVNNWETTGKRWAEPDMTDGQTDRHRQLRGATAGNQAFLATEVPADYNQAGLRRSKPGHTPAPQAAKHPLLQQQLLLFGCRAPPARLPPSVSPPQAHSLPAPGIPANTVGPA